MSPRLFAALLAIVAADALAQDPAQLGTLFQTPQERATLDSARRGERASGTPGLRANPVITGYVKRSDGKSTVFIDNQPFDVKGARAEAYLQPRNVQSYVAPPPQQGQPRDSATVPSDGTQGKAAAPASLNASSKPEPGNAPR